MRPMKIFVAISILALAACGSAPALGDYCARASRVELRDLCGPGVAPAIAGAWGSCSITTRADAERLAAESRKFDAACRKGGVSAQN